MATTELASSRPTSLDIRPADPARRKAEAIADSIFASAGASNTYLVVTDGGNVLINTGLGSEAPVHRRAFAAASPAPIRYILLTQGHVDHVGGIDLFKEEHPDAVVIAQHNIAACQADDERIQAFRYRRNLRFFPEFLAPPGTGAEPNATSGLGPAQSIARPDVTFDKEHRFDLGGVRFELFSVPGGETIDSALVWLPDRRVLFSGNALGPLFPHLPNLYTIRGDRLRFALPYLDVVEKMIELGPEMLVTGHFEPIADAGLIRRELARLRDAVRFLHDRTVDGMNAGKDVFTLMREVRLPEHLEVGQAYGTAPWCVRSIYEGYAGWFRFRSTTELYERPVEEVYGELARMAGTDALAARAADLLSAGRTLEAVHLAEIALAGDPRHAGALVVYQEAHERLLAASEPGNRWQIYWLRGEIGRARALLTEVEACCK